MKTMKIVIAPDSFKGTLSAKEVAVVIRDSFKRVFDEKNFDAIIDVVPIADGGEGTSTVLYENLGGVRMRKTITGPEFQAVDAFYSILDHATAVIEVAETSGLKHCHNFDTKGTTTYGFGELILDALNHNVREIVLCLGGSGTTDGGAGMAAALGATFAMGDITDSYPTGATLHSIEQLSVSDLDPRIRRTAFKMLIDVNNPLHGKTGAAHVYAPQKGASSDDVILLDQGLQHYDAMLFETFDKDCASFPGAGAAGGLGAGCFAFLQAEALPGIETLLDMIGFDTVIEDADLIITGEGKIDEQSFMGKAISGVIQRSNGKPVVLICGVNACETDCPQLEHHNVFAATDYTSKADSLRNPVHALSIASEECARYVYKTYAKKV